MVTVYKRHLSGGSDGMGIKVVQTATAGTTIHTAVAGTTDGTFDEVWLYAMNNHTADVSLTIEYGDASAENNIKMTIPYAQGLYLIIPGLILHNGKTVKAFASVANVVTIHGWVNTMTDA